MSIRAKAARQHQSGHTTSKQRIGTATLCNQLFDTHFGPEGPQVGDSFPVALMEGHTNKGKFDQVRDVPSAFAEAGLSLWRTGGEMVVVPLQDVFVNLSALGVDEHVELHGCAPLAHIVGRAETEESLMFHLEKLKAGKQKACQRIFEGVPAKAEMLPPTPLNAAVKSYKIGEQRFVSQRVDARPDREASWNMAGRSVFAPIEVKRGNWPTMNLRQLALPALAFSASGLHPWENFRRAYLVVFDTWGCGRAYTFKWTNLDITAYTVEKVTAFNYVAS